MSKVYTILNNVYAYCVTDNTIRVLVDRREIPLSNMLSILSPIDFLNFKGYLGIEQFLWNYVHVNITNLSFVYLNEGIGIFRADQDWLLLVTNQKNIEVRLKEDRYHMIKELHPMEVLSLMKDVL